MNHDIHHLHTYSRQIDEPLTQTEIEEIETELFDNQNYRLENEKRIADEQANQRTGSVTSASIYNFYNPSC